MVFPMFSLLSKRDTRLYLSKIYKSFENINKYLFLTCFIESPILSHLHIKIVRLGSVSHFMS